MEILKDLGIDTSKVDSEAIQLFLQYLAEKSILPELYIVLGNKIIDFLLLFAGCTIQVPSLKEIKDKLCDIDIYVNVSQAQDVKKAYQELKKKYNMPIFELERRYENVRKWADSSIARQYTPSS